MVTYAEIGDHLFAHDIGIIEKDDGRCKKPVIGC